MAQFILSSVKTRYFFVYKHKMMTTENICGLCICVVLVYVCMDVIYHQNRIKRYEPFFHSLLIPFMYADAERNEHEKLFVREIRFVLAPFFFRYIFRFVFFSMAPVLWLAPGFFRHYTSNYVSSDQSNFDYI